MWFIKLINKPAHVQYALTHGTLVDMRLAIWASDRIIFSGADQLPISLHAPEFMALILTRGQRKYYNVRQDLESESTMKVRHGLIMFGRKQRMRFQTMDYELKVLCSTCLLQGISSLPKTAHLICTKSSLWCYVPNLSVCSCADYSTCKNRPQNTEWTEHIHLARHSNI